MVTIRDVAARAGVSLSTVSIVLNNQTHRKITEETAQRVVRAALDLHYHPNPNARKLRRLHADDMTIGLFWPVGERMHQLSGVVANIQKTLIQLNLNITLLIHPYRPNYLKNELITDRIHIYSAAIMGIVEDQDLVDLERKKPPFKIMIINHKSAFPYLIINQFELGRLIGRTLIKENATRLGAIAYNQLCSGKAQRQAGIRDALGMDRWLELLQYTATVDDSASAGYHAVKTWIKDGFLPDTIYCEDVTIALGALHCIYESGISCPTQCSILALDHGTEDLSEFAVPPLSTIEIPLRQMIGEALRILLTENNRLQEKANLLSFIPRLHLRSSLRQQPDDII